MKSAPLALSPSSILVFFLPSNWLATASFSARSRGYTVTRHGEALIYTTGRQARVAGLT